MKFLRMGLAIIKILHTAFKSLDQELNAPALIDSHHESNMFTQCCKIKTCHGMTYCFDNSSCEKRSHVG